MTAEITITTWATGEAVGTTIVLATRTADRTAGAVPIATPMAPVDFVVGGATTTRITAPAIPIGQRHVGRGLVVRVQHAGHDLEEITQPPLGQGAADRQFAIPFAQMPLVDVRMDRLGTAGDGLAGQNFVARRLAEVFPEEHDLKGTQWDIFQFDVVGLDGERASLEVDLVVGELLVQGEQFFVKLAECGDIRVQRFFGQVLQNRDAPVLQPVERSPQVAPLLSDRTTPAAGQSQGQQPY